MADHAAPLVSICIPTYNSENTIKDTLASIVGQRYRNLVIQIVDNASTDATLDIVGSFSDPRLSVHRHDSNVGSEGNFNRCIALAKGKYTAIYHADDVYENNMVEEQVQFLERCPAAGGVFTEASLIDEGGTVIGAIKQPQDILPNGPLLDFQTIFKAVLKHSNFLICPSFMTRTSIYQNEIVAWRAELFDTSADLDVWLRVLKNHPCGIIQLPLMQYRIGRSQGSSAVRQGTERSDFFKVIDHHLQAPEVKRILTADDHKNYARLERRDRVMRASNWLLAGHEKEASALCDGLLSRDSMLAALQTRRGLATLVLGLFIKISVALRLGIIARPLVKELKRRTNK
jgi:glycosyltransferase involved in cell wall biosynthesis